MEQNNQQNGGLSEFDDIKMSFDTNDFDDISVSFDVKDFEQLQMPPQKKNFSQSFWMPSGQDTELSSRPSITTEYGEPAILLKEVEIYPKDERQEAAGYIESFMQGLKDYEVLQQEYDFLSRASKQQIIDYYNRKYSEHLLSPQQEDNMVKKALRSIGTTLPTIGKVALAGATGGALGGATVVGAPLGMAVGSIGFGIYEGQKLSQPAAFEETYFEAKQQGKSDDEAFEKARKVSNISRIAGGIEGGVGGLAGGTVAQGGKSLVKNVVREIMTDALIGSTAAGARRVTENIAAQRQGIQRETASGIGEEMSMEAAISVGVGLLLSPITHGKDLLKGRRKRLVSALAAEHPEKVIKAIDNAAQQGIINDEDANKVKQEVIESAKAYNSLPKDMPLEQKEALASSIKELNELEKELQQANDVTRPFIEAKINQIKKSIPVPLPISYVNSGYATTKDLVHGQRYVMDDGSIMVWDSQANTFSGDAASVAGDSKGVEKIKGDVGYLMNRIYELEQEKRLENEQGKRRIDEEIEQIKSLLRRSSEAAKRTISDEREGAKVEAKEQSYDSKDEQRLSGKVKTRQEPVEARPDEGAGDSEAGGNRVFQEETEEKEGGQLKETRPGSVDLYFSNPNPDGSFNVSSKTSSFKEDKGQAGVEADGVNKATYEEGMPTEKDVEQIQKAAENKTIAQQVKDFGVPEQNANAVASVITRLFEGLKKAGLTDKEKVEEWVSMGKGGEEKEFTLKISGKDIKVKPINAEVVNGFYSPLEKIINETKFDKLPAKQWLEKFAKGEEAKWTGLQEWLSQQQGSVSKADIQKFLKENRVQIVEVVKGVNNQRILDIERQVEELKAEREELLLEQEEDFSERLEEISNEIRLLNEEKNKLDKFKDKTKYEEYQLEGEKDNYKEVLVVLSFDKDWWEQYKNNAERKTFDDSHWEEPNVLVHLRMNTRTDSEGNKVLFLEEIQSDWGQKGRKVGFKQDNLYIKPKKEGENQWDVDGVKILYFEKGVDGKNYRTIDKNKQQVWTKTLDEAAKIANETALNKEKYLFAIPAAPFVTDTNAWVKLALKVALKEAVAQGVDKIAWTTGRQQNERYDLSKQVDDVYTSSYGEEWINGKYGKGEWISGRYEKRKDVEITLKNGHVIKFVVDDIGKIQSGDFAGERLDNVVGKEMAEKILSAKEDTNFNPQDLRIGGKGMIDFYGDPKEGKLGIVGQVAKSLFKQEPKTVEIKISEEYLYEDKNTVIEETEREYILKDKKGNLLASISKEEGNKYAPGQARKNRLLYEARKNRDLRKKIVVKTTQHAIEITPELKAAVAVGLPLFKDAQGQYYIKSGKNIIEAIKDFDGSPEATTALIHEIIHPAVVSIIDGAKAGNAAGKKHTKTIVEEFNKWVRKKKKELKSAKGENAASDIKVVPLSSITTDEKRFQNRASLNEQIIEHISKNWSDADQDPIHVWKDPKDGKTYVLSGHHRYYAAKKAGRNYVKIIDRTNDFDETQAIRFAKEEANTNRSMETPLERAKLLREKIKRGDSKEDIERFLKREGRNATYIKNLAALNPNGKTINALERLSDVSDKQNQKELEQRADCIGEARRTINGLTDAHEDEMYNFLFNRSASARIRTKVEFLQKVRSVFKPLYPNEPLNLERFKYKTDGELAYEEEVNNKKQEINDVQKKIDQINDRFTNPNNPEYISIDNRDYEVLRRRADELLAKLEAERKALQKQLEDIYRNKGKYLGGSTNYTLFKSDAEVTPADEITEEQLIEWNEAFKNGTITEQYRAVQEFIASTWEQYMREGSSGFSKAFQEVLDAITEVFKQVYRHLTQKDLTPELRAMFDELLSKNMQQESGAKGGDIDAQIEQVKRQLKERNAGKLRSGLDFENLDLYVELAYLYLKKGVKTIAEFAKELGRDVDEVVQKAWDKAKKRHDDEVALFVKWKDYAKKQFEDEEGGLSFNDFKERFSKKFGVNIEDVELAEIYSEAQQEYDAERDKGVTRRDIDRSIKRRPEPVVVDEYKALKSQLRMEAKAAIQGYREGVKEHKGEQQYFAKKIKEFLLGNAFKNRLSDKQAKAIVNKAMSVRTDKSLERFISYAEKVIDDINYAERMDAMRSQQQKAKKRKHTYLDSDVKKFLSVNPEWIPDSFLPKYQQALDELSGRVPNYTTFFQIKDDIFNLFDPPSPFDEIKTMEQAQELYNKIGVNKVRSIEEYRRLLADISSFKRKMNELLYNGAITEQQYDDIMQQAGKDQQAVEQKYRSEIYSLNTSLIQDFKSLFSAISLDNITDEGKALLRKLNSLNNDDLRMLSPEELYNLASVLDNVKENGFVDAYRLNDILASVNSKKHGRRLAEQIKKAKPFAQLKSSVSEMVNKLAETYSAFWENRLGLGLGDRQTGPYYQHVVREMEQAVNDYRSAVEQGYRFFNSLKKKYHIDKDKMNRIGLFAIYLREYGLGQHKKGQRDSEGAPYGTRDWFKEILRQQKETQTLKSAEIKEIKKALDTFKKKDGQVDIEDVERSFREGTTEYLTEDEMNFLKEALQWKSDNLTGKQMAANAFRGVKFDIIPYHIKRIRKDSSGKDITSSAEISDNKMVKIQEGSGKEVKTEEIGAIEHNFEKIFTDNLEGTMRDYYLTPMLQQVSRTLREAEDALGGNNGYVQVMRDNLRDAINNELLVEQADKLTNKIVSNLLKSRASMVLIDPIRTLGEFFSSLLSYPARAKQLDAYMKIFENKDIVSRLMHDTNSLFKDKTKLNKHIDIEEGQLKGQNFFSLATSFFSAMPERLGLAPVWMSVFESRFTKEAGVPFDKKAYMEDEGYAKKYRDAINAAAAEADKRYASIAGSTTLAGKMRRARLFPYIKALGIGKDIAVSTKTPVGKMLTFMVGYPFRETEAFMQSAGALREAAQDKDAKPLDIVSEALPIIGVVLGGTTYGLYSTIRYELSRMLLGSDKEAEEAEENIKNLFSPKGMLREVLASSAAVAGARYSGAGRQLIKLMGSIAYNYSEKQEDKEAIRSMIRNITFENPFELKRDKNNDIVKFMQKERLAHFIVDAFPAIKIIIDNANKEIQAAGGVDYILGKAERGEMLTEPEKSALVTLYLLANTYNMIAMWGAKAIPTTTLNRLAEKAIQESKEARKKKTIRQMYDIDLPQDETRQIDAPVIEP